MMKLPANVKSAWHLVTLSKRIPKNKALKVDLMGVPVALFRGADGLGALEDRCPHRNHPLSEGRIVDGDLECPYHGWRFQNSGDCTKVPGCITNKIDQSKMGARAFKVIERQGGVFVKMENGGPDEPKFPPTFGSPGYDHFWWEQGTWKGRAYDAIENVMDPFHTNHLHDGYIRKNSKRLPVNLQVIRYGDSVEMVIEQTEPDLGLMSKFLEKDREHSRTRYYPPTVVQARWEGKRELTLCVTAFFTPVSDGSFRPFACFTTPKGLTPGWLKQAAIRLFLMPVVAQDRRALERQYEVMQQFQSLKFVEGPGDILGNTVHSLWSGRTIEKDVGDKIRAFL